MSASSGDFDEAVAWRVCKWNKVKKAAGARSICTVNAKDLDTREEQVEEFGRMIGELCVWSARWKDGWRKPQKLCNDEELIIEGSELGFELSTNGSMASKLSALCKAILRRHVELQQEYTVEE